MEEIDMKALYHKFLLCLSLGLVAGCQTVTPPVDASVGKFAELTGDPDVQLVDVRTKEEFEEGHIQGARLLDVRRPDFMRLAMKDLSKKRPVAVYCRSGRRSADAARKLSQKGFRVTNLLGGFLEWNRQGQQKTTAATP